jgi:hypothetical protein
VCAKEPVVAGGGVCLDSVLSRDAPSPGPPRENLLVSLRSLALKNESAFFEAASDDGDGL